jgi:flavorubredoxin
MRGIFSLVREAVEKIINPADLRHIGFSHFEADECGALNEWLAIAPNATPVCSLVGAMVSVNDFAARPANSSQHFLNSRIIHRSRSIWLLRFQVCRRSLQRRFTPRS